MPCAVKHNILHTGDVRGTSGGRPGDVRGTSGGRPGDVRGTSGGRPGDVRGTSGGRPGDVRGTSGGRPGDVRGTSGGRPGDVRGTSGIIRCIIFPKSFKNVYTRLRCSPFFLNGRGKPYTFVDVQLGEKKNRT